jgi:tetratricopeptide (TPR) repeat protein
MGARMMSRQAGDARWLLTLRVGAVVVAWVWWALVPSAGWVVALAAVPVLATLIKHRSLGSPFLTVCLAVFLATAVGALWATYDRDATRLIFDHPVGWQKLWGLILAVLFFYALVTIGSAPGLHWAVGLLVGLGALVAAGFVATNDWVAQPALWPAITRLGQALQALLPPLPRGVLNPNIAGGVVAPLLPLSVGLMLEGRRLGDRLWVAVGLLSAAAMAVAFVLTTSRGAWLATAGALALTGLWRLVGRLTRTERLGRIHRPIVFAVAVALVAAVAALAWVAIAPLRQLVLTTGPVANRLAIFSQAALLFRDYAFTGSGLGTFPLVHSTYALMIHVAVIPHAHALPLNVAVEQGLIGADALLLAWAAASWLGLRTLARSDESRPLLAAALFSLAVLVIHGLVDDPLYSSRGVLFFWVPVGLVFAAAQGATAPRPSRTAGPEGARGVPRLAVAAALVVIVALLGLVLRPVAAIWHANLGAVRQTQVELRAYDSRRFGDRTLDQVRRQEDLSAAVRHFERALTLDPGQVTARTRLAQVALARRDYDAALGHARAAWDAGYRDRVTRLVLGDALVAHGEVEEAAQLVRGLEQAQARLEGQAFYRYQRHDDWQRAAYAWRTVLALDPDDSGARAAAARAEERASQP